MTTHTSSDRVPLAPLALVALLTPFLLSASRAHGQDAELSYGTFDAPVQDPVIGSGGGRSNWEFVLGIGARVAPEFEGAEDFETTALPFFSISYGDRVTFDLGGLNVDLLTTGPLSLSTQIGYDPGREEDDSDYLAGLGDVDGGATLGLGIGYALGPLDLYMNFDRTLGDSDGMVGRLGAQYTRKVGNVLLAANLSANWADEDHMQNYFGVTAAQSAASGLAQYEAESGFKRVDLGLSATYVIRENWILRGEIEVGSLIGDAADSPIVREEMQSSASVLLGYRF
ncbi:MAG: MipA/OmpV family protein [Rhodobacteraceae bacterium]|nr:MipA/OmpV family protein [Paracoccaceae bacterium]MBR9820217.1 MipA/OmpV family protein [Paracoccaceae bacterium]